MTAGSSRKWGDVRSERVGAIGQIRQVIESVRREFAADPRLAVYEVEVAHADRGVVIFGSIAPPVVAEALRERVARLDSPIAIRDAIVRLPEATEVPCSHGVVTAAAAPMLAGPVVSESHLSQVLLGHRVLVLREYGRWLQCRSADDYLGWIHRGYVRRMDEVEARAWELGAGAPIHFSLGAEVLDDDGRVRARLPWGARLARKNDIAYLPDGTAGTFAGESIAAAELSERFPPTGAAVVATARLWIGAPYLWGGTSPWGVDCSGLAQATFRTHGIELPRDSDQQAAIGDEIDPDQDFAAVRAGDLLFFAEPDQSISHVAISTGRSGIIHSALGNGGVWENDLGAGSAYERELRSLLVAVRRVIRPGS